MSDEAVADETALSAQATQLKDTLSAEERDQLSRVLFPETDTTEVEVLGKTRELRPLPVRTAQRLKKTLAPVVTELQRGLASVERDPNTEYDAEEAILRALEKSAEVLADFYGWDDVKAALAKDGLAIAEYQALASVQVQVNGTNDFLLSGLRTVVRWMQIAELMMVRFQSTLTGLR